MSIISNKLLIEFAQDPIVSNMLSDRRSSQELLDAENAMYKEFDTHLSKIFLEFNPLDDLLPDEPGLENGVISHLEEYSFFVKKFLEITPELKKQMKEWERIITTGICERNLKLKEIIMDEIRILERILSHDPVKYYITYMDRILKVSEPDLTFKKRAIIISGIMAELEIFKKEKFLTLEEANMIAKEKARKDINYEQGGPEMIYDRIKKYIDPDFEDQCITVYYS